MKKIQILGPGCMKCKALANSAEMAAKEMGIEFQIEKVTDIKEIMKFEVIMTPALVIDGQVKAVGKILTPDQIKAML